MGQVLLECKSLKKYFNTPGGLLHAVDNVSFEIEEGRTLGVVGESGCGKSTLGRTILRLIPATSGEVIFEGENILDYDQKRIMELRRKMQIIFQDPFSSLDPRKTIFQTISEPLRVHKLYKESREISDKTYEMMETVGLAERYANIYPHEIDGGRRQRIGIARALTLNPQFIVCDEPVSALDVSIQAQILNLMMDLQDSLRLTYMFITHDLSVVKHISDDILVMYLGQVVEYASSDDLFANPLHPYTQALLKSIPVPEIGHAAEQAEFLIGELSSPVEPKPGCRFLPRCPISKPECGEKDPELREIEKGHLVACSCNGRP
jgi:peptide/nickel transport system ATP-binding protein